MIRFIAGRSSIRCFAGLLLALAAAPLSGRAQDAPEGFAQAAFTGPLETISRTRLSVQGQSVALTEETLLKGLDARGKIVDLVPADFSPGAQVAVFLEEEGGVPQASAVFRGQAFFLRGTVTGLKLGSDGYVETLTVDGRFSVAVAEADFIEAGGGSGVPPSGQGGGEADPSVEVGDEVALKGIVQKGAFAAVEGRVLYAEEGGDYPPDSDSMEVALRRTAKATARPHGPVHGRGLRHPAPVQPSGSKRP